MSSVVQKLMARFRDAHPHLQAEYSTGFGMDPNRRGENGIVVYAHSEDQNERDKLVVVARGAVPGTWEGYPVYVKGTGVPSV